jgi:hypothetical protein
MIWQPGTLVLDDGSGSGPIWDAVSLRLMMTSDSMALQAEFRNTSGIPQAAPELNMTLLTEGQSLGTENYSPENEWAAAGSSVYYQWCCVLGGSLFVGDWDDVQLWLAPPYFGPPNMAAYENLSIDMSKERLTNNGVDTLGEVSFAAILRDSAGIFTGSCFGPYTGANLLPGKSVRAPGLREHN